MRLRTRRTFIMASAPGGLLAGAARRRRNRSPARFVPRQAGPSSPAQGEGGQHLPGLHAVVRDPDLRAGRSRRSRAGVTRCPRPTRLCVLPAWAPDPAAGLRPRPHQGADETHQPGQGPRRRSEVRAHHMGRGAGHGGQKMVELRRAGEAQSSCTCAGATRPRRPTCCTAPLPKIYGTHQLLLAQRHLRRGREDGPGLTQGFFGYRDYDLEKTGAWCWGAPIRWRPTAWCPTPSTASTRSPRGTVIAVDPPVEHRGRQGA